MKLETPSCNTLNKGDEFLVSAFWLFLALSGYLTPLQVTPLESRGILGHKIIPDWILFKIWKPQSLSPGKHSWICHILNHSPKVYCASLYTKHSWKCICVDIKMSYQAYACFSRKQDKFKKITRDLRSTPDTVVYFERWSEKTLSLQCTKWLLLLELCNYLEITGDLPGKKGLPHFLKHYLGTLDLFSYY